VKVGAVSDWFFFSESLEENEAIVKRELMTLFNYLVYRIVDEGVIPTPDESLDMTLELQENNWCCRFVLLTDRDVPFTNQG
jgi:hypothetical protein